MTKGQSIADETSVNLCEVLGFLKCFFKVFLTIFNRYINLIKQLTVSIIVFLLPVFKFWEQESTGTWYPQIIP